MFIFDPDARRASVCRPGKAPIDGQLVCYYPCPRLITFDTRTARPGCARGNFVWS